MSFRFGIYIYIYLKLVFLSFWNIASVSTFLSVCFYCMSHFLGIFNFGKRFYFIFMWGIYFVCCMIWLWHMELLWCTHEVHQKIISISMLPFCIDAMCASSTSIVNTVVRIILVLGIVTGIKYFVLSLPSCCGSISPCLLITWICK